MPRSKPRRSSELAVLAVLVLACAVGAPRPARAGGGKAAVADYRAAVSRGTALFAQEDYPGAREAFETAFDIHADPVLIFNIASTYRREGDLEHAIESYRRYLSLSEDGDDARRQLARETIDSLQDTLDRRAADKEREAREQAKREAEQRAAEERAAKERAAKERAAREQAAAEQADADRAAPPSLQLRQDQPSPWPSRLRVSGTVLAVAGGAALVLAGIDAARARDAEIRLTGVTSWDQSEAQLYRDGSAARHRAIISGAIGLGLVTAGTTLYLLGRHHDHERHVAIAPTAHHDGAVAVVRGSF